MPVPDDANWTYLDDSHRFIWMADHEGIIFSHRDGDTWCENGIMFERGWTLNSESPLDITPSIKCLIDNHHGYIRNGQWVDA